MTPIAAGPTADQAAADEVLRLPAPAWRRAGPLARRRKADGRSEALHRLVEHYRLPTGGRGAWARVYQLFTTLHPAEALTRPLPRGLDLDTVDLAWVRRATITPKALRRNYRAWLRRRGPIPHQKAA